MNPTKPEPTIKTPEPPPPPPYSPTMDNFKEQLGRVTSTMQMNLDILANRGESMQSLAERSSTTHNSY